MKTLKFTLLYFGLLFLSISQAFADSSSSSNKGQVYYDKVMGAEPYLPANISDSFISCPLSTSSSRVIDKDYRTSQQVNYQDANWEQRIASDWDSFDVAADQGRVLVIDFHQSRQGLAYRYLANAQTQDQLYEPWSSSKIMAFTAAVAKARQKGVGATSLAGDTPLADLITSIHSYQPFGAADGNSNAIATYFLNTVGRDKATALFHNGWLQLANPLVRFRGSYAVKVFKPRSAIWQSTISANKVTMPELEKGSDDPGYQSYRCEDCGLTGNKPMTTLAQAEWLKRLASHERDELTRQPHIQASDIEVLFYGTGHSDPQHQVGGMLQGIGLMLSRAVAKAISGLPMNAPKAVLDKMTQGKWRIWQKSGSGPSETRGTGESVVLAHVCLPDYQGGREFTLAAQTSVVGEGESSVGQAGMKMQALLNQAMGQLLSQNNQQH
ncbi:hypothetical protein [uncultured Paraglaciecola sp.]|uniref:hypothetical protein n=1 Tax=uncultured Paraglaciecola sp. TaxID=1765024 RepID=UPI002609F634|nr:hypothetical protein [uncultured Paraglaciecola sp.]